MGPQTWSSTIGLLKVAPPSVDRTYSMELSTEGGKAGGQVGGPVKAKWV